MKKINLVQLITAVLGLIVVLLLPYFKFSFLGVAPLRISALMGISGMYPIFLIPVFGMLILAILSFDEIRPISLAAGVVLLIVQIVFVICQEPIILNGDISFLLSKASGLMDMISGADSNVEIRQVLAPFLKVDWGCYLGIALNVFYIAAGVLFGGGSSSGGSGKGGRGRTIEVEKRRF